MGVSQLTQHTALRSELGEPPFPLHALQVQPLEGHQGGGVLTRVHPAASQPTGDRGGGSNKVTARWGKAKVDITGAMGLTGALAGH